MSQKVKLMKAVYSSDKSLHSIKVKTELTYGRAIVFGLAYELVLFIVQYLLLFLYYTRNPGAPFSFTSAYMMSWGFYIFLIPGFILFATVVFLIMRKYTIPSAAYFFVFLLAAAVLEVSFYLAIAADYRGPFVYSILDKVVGTGLGVIGYYAISRTEEMA